MPASHLIARLMLICVLSCMVVISGVTWVSSGLHGTQLAFTDLQRDVRVLDLHHGFSISLSPPDIDVYPDLTWSPDGQFIVYAAPRGINTLPYLYVVNMRGESRQLTTTPLRVGNPQLRWSPDGQYIAFSNIPEDASGCEITIIDVGSGEQQPLVDEGICARFNWSPDGIHFSFDTRVLRLDTHEIVYDTAGGELQWSPDGSMIIFERYQQGDYYLYTAQSEGQGERMLTHGQDAIWLPDGRILFARSSLGGSDIITSVWMMDSSGEHLTQLTPEHYGVWSPDMRWAASLIRDDIIEPTIPQYERTHLYLLNVDTAALNVIPEAEDFAGFAWRP